MLPYVCLITYADETQHADRRSDRTKEWLSTEEGKERHIVLDTLTHVVIILTIIPITLIHT